MGVAESTELELEQACARRKGRWHAYGGRVGRTQRRKSAVISYQQSNDAQVAVSPCGSNRRNTQRRVLKTEGISKLAEKVSAEMSKQRNR
jgi:hypothetical protein